MKFLIISLVAIFLVNISSCTYTERIKDGKTAYLWSNIGKLGFFEVMIDYRSNTANKSKNYPYIENYKKPLNKKSTCVTKEDRASIPLPLAHETARKIRQLMK